MVFRKGTPGVTYYACREQSLVATSRDPIIVAVMASDCGVGQGGGSYSGCHIGYQQPFTASNLILFVCIIIGCGIECYKKNMQMHIPSQCCFPYGQCKGVSHPPHW